MIRKLILSAAAALLVIGAAPTPPVHAAGDDLPDIGSPSDAVLSKGRATQIGRSVLMQLRAADMVLEDPELDEYVESLGHRLSAHAQEGNQDFEFFIVNDGGINAFALPGGYIGVNSGLILATQRESELAGVLAHEIAHVTQKHIARRAAAQGKSSMLAGAAVLAAILMGVAGGANTDVVQATAMSAQALAVQQSINYTRINEYEADRVGLIILNDSGFDPNGMPEFFETMSRLQGAWANRVPEFLLTHPVSSTRIAETRSRVEQLEPRPYHESPEYLIMRARMKALTYPTADGAVTFFADQLEKTPEQYVHLRYGLAVALIRAGKADKAVPILFALREEDESVITFHSTLGEALMAAHQPAESLLVFEQAMALFPRNVPLTIRYAESLMYADQYEKAHAVLLDLFNAVSPTPVQVKLIANAAGASGEKAEAHYYMSEYYLRSGNLEMGIDQLNLALAQPDLNEIQRARFIARRDELLPYLPDGAQPRNIEQARRE